MSFADVLAMLRTRAFLFMACAFFLLGLVTVGTISNFVPMMTDCGFTPARAGRPGSATAARPGAWC